MVGNMKGWVRWEVQQIYGVWRSKLHIIETRDRTITLCGVAVPVKTCAYMATLSPTPEELRDECARCRKVDMTSTEWVGSKVDDRSLTGVHLKLS